MRCPLCSGSRIKLQRVFSSNEIADRWERDFSIDVCAEFQAISAVELYSCGECGIGFFKPDSVAGSAAMYEMLEKLPWYYMARKWEHDAALEDINGATRGIEIGCGFGAFVARVIKEQNFSFEGCEQNSSAVRVAQSSGIPVKLESLEALAERFPNTYDVVCAFQVLEHVVNPGDFLECACKLLRRGGKLIIGVPNNHSYNGRLYNIFDMPPHHMTRWNSEVLRGLHAWFPVKLLRIAYEPLQNNQIEWFIEAYEVSLRRLGVGWLVHPWIRSRIARVIRDTPIRKFLKGETIYACFARQ